MLKTSINIQYPHKNVGVSTTVLAFPGNRKYSYPLFLHIPLMLMSYLSIVLWFRLSNGR